MLNYENMKTKDIYEKLKQNRRLFSTFFAKQHRDLKRKELALKR